MRLARVWLRRHGFQTHQAHQPLHVLAVDDGPFEAQRFAQLAAPVERPLQMDLVDAQHQRQFLSAGAHRLVVQPRAADSEQLALASKRNLFLSLNHGSALLQRGRASPRAKKSRSTVSSPIFSSNSFSRSEPLAGSPGCSKTEAARSMNSFFHL